MITANDVTRQLLLIRLARVVLDHPVGSTARHQAYGDLVEAAGSEVEANHTLNPLIAERASR